MHRWILNSGGFFFFPAIQLSEVGRLHRGHGFPDLAYTSPISLWTATRHRLYDPDCDYRSSGSCCPMPAEGRESLGGVAELVACEEGCF